MAGKPDNKKKLLCMISILKNETDSDHPMSMQKLLDRLGEEGYAAERKSIYTDITLFNEFSTQFDKSHADEIVYVKPKGYYYSGGLFEMADLRMLAEAVASSRSITEKHSKELMEKLAGLTSRHQSRQVFRQILVTDRVKTENRTVPYTIDVINQCVEADRQIRFLYNDWVLNEENHPVQMPRHGGEPYVASPYALLWDDEKYYLVARTENRGILHFRVDKMTDARMLPSNRTGIKEWNNTDPSVYTRSTFGMFDGDRKGVQLVFASHLLGVMVDRFGTDIHVRRVSGSEDLLEIKVDVCVSPQFFGWITGIGPDVRIAAPASVVAQYKAHLDGIRNNYSEETE